MIARSDRPFPRIGITVSRQVGNAVRRNRIKRLVREAFRKHRSLLPSACDLVVIAKTGCPVDHIDAVRSELEGARAALHAAWNKAGRYAGGRS